MEIEITTSWHSYPSPRAIGHMEILSILEDPVTVEEKIDGSQFSFGVFNGELKCRSKSAQIQMLAPEKMFSVAVANVQEFFNKGLLQEGWTYRCEYLQKPKHNTLPYDRVPNLHLMGLDINVGHEQYLTYENKKEEFAKLGLETTPLLFAGVVDDYQTFRKLVDETDSVLGGAKIEGVVVKNYSKFTKDGKAMLGKFVSEHFKEVHSKEWKNSNPSTNTIIDHLQMEYRSKARWEKAIQHLKEEGKLEGSPKDIGLLIREVPEDILKECKEEIKEKLFNWAWGNIQRGVTAGLPEYYKERLLKEAFSEKI